MSTNKQLGAGLLLLACAVSSALADERTPLTPAALSRCAEQVQQLRQESGRLNGENRRLDARRVDINQRSAALQAEAAALPRDDLAKGLDLRQRVQQHQADARAFNAQIEQIRRDIGALNAVKLDYDRSCANRPYRRADLQAMPPAAQDAMRTGLADVEVPYIEGAP